MFMKTIEERAKREGIISQHRADYPYDKKSVEFGYIQGAYDQKEVDKEELLKLKSAWEKEAQTNHDDVANYKQGYHDAIEKACDWLGPHLAEVADRYDSTASLLLRHVKENFRIAMEKEL